MLIFDRLEAAQLIVKPFPHMVIENCAGIEHYRNLLLQDPGSLVSVPDCGPQGKKYYYSFRKAATDGRCCPSWLNVLKAHVTEVAAKKWLLAFSSAIRETYPHLEERYGNLESWTVGVRGVEEQEEKTLLVDAQLVKHSAVWASPCQERGPHLKGTNKLLIGEWFLRYPEDCTEGGDFEIYSSKPGVFLQWGESQQLMNHTRALSLEKVIDYKADSVVLFMNSPHSFQAFSPRSPGRFPLFYMNLIIEFSAPLFPLPSVTKRS